MKKYIIPVLVLGIALLAGCRKAEQAQKPAPATEAATVPVPTTEATEAYIPPIQDIIKNEAGTKLETPYITLYYPTQWTELTDVSVRAYGDNCRVDFRSNVGSQGELDLFTLYIGPDEIPEGYCHGTLDGMKVYTQVYQYDTAQWSEEDFGELGRQQEYVNELILQLLEDPGFVQS